MKMTTWNREAGYVSVVLFDNGTSAAVSTKTYATKKGAEAANTRLQELCGEGYSNMNLPYRTMILVKVGEIYKCFSVWFSIKKSLTIYTSVVRL